jgi:hypothetical protein
VQEAHLAPLHHFTQNARPCRETPDIISAIRCTSMCRATQQRQIGYWIERAIGAAWSCEDLYSMNRCAVTSIASENAAASEAQAT